MAAGARRVLRAVWAPRPVPEQRHETWACPACGQAVEILSGSTTMRAHGYWLPPGRLELLALCARQSGTHRRDGSPLRTPELPPAVSRWEPVVVLGGWEGPGPRPFVRLTPPAGVAYVPTADGTAYEVLILDHLGPGDLVGAGASLLASGRRVGEVPVSAVWFDAAGRCIDVSRLPPVDNLNLT